MNIHHELHISVNIPWVDIKLFKVIKKCYSIFKKLNIKIRFNNQVFIWMYFKRNNKNLWIQIYTFKIIQIKYV